MAGKGLIHSPPKSNEGLMAAFADVLQKYPALRRHAAEYAIVAGRPMLAGDDRQLETYAPDESWNPIPGKATTEVYNQNPAEMPNLIAGDMLHHLANVDPNWAKMKADVAPADMDKFRQDEFLMGFLTPDKADEWKNAYSPGQRKKLGLMADYLMKGTMPQGYR